ncbi:M28 family peptidase [Pseudomonadales bacterium]|nr:M28 family peptidase [Pseudomonadales bacterium]
MAKEDKYQSMQKMATNPTDLVNMLSDISFLSPEAYRQKLRGSGGGKRVPLGITESSNIDDISADITAEELEGYVEDLVAISMQSKEDGEILWGRIQGTQYERLTLDLIKQKLESFGDFDVHQDTFPVRYPQWRPLKNSLEVTDSVHHNDANEYRFENAVTPFPSALTEEQGNKAELIFVGTGSPAELNGRDLGGKIVLLRSTSMGGALIHTARTAFSRIATGKWGTPLGVIVWWDVAGGRQVAGRVGSVGGGDEIGLALPWIGIGNEDGFYIRKLIDRATPDDPVIVRLTVRGEMESGADRMSGNVYGYLPGKSESFIVLTAHVDGYFYAVHDNGATVATLLALARHYAAQGKNNREHGLLFLFVGDHENPGVGGTINFVEEHETWLKENLLTVIRPEKLGLMLREGGSPTNIETPMTPLITNHSPLLVELLRQSAEKYQLAVTQNVSNEPVADEAAFHPPYADLNAISIGWQTIGRTYHSTADVESRLIGYSKLQRWAQSFAYIIEALEAYTKKDLEKDASPVPEQSAYQADGLKMTFGNF